MRTRYVWDKEMQCLIEIGDRSNRPEPEKRTKPSGIIRDIEPYKTVATDVAIGAPTIIGSRSRHREFLRRNGYTEVGNDRDTTKREELSKSDRIADIKRALGE